jgi:hypothetical protein
MDRGNMLTLASLVVALLDLSWRWRRHTSERRGTQDTTTSSVSGGDCGRKLP